MNRTRPKPRSLSFESRIILISIAAALPGLILALVLLWRSGASTEVRWTVAAALGLCLLILSSILHSHLVYPLRTLSNLLAALREEDYSIRARGAGPDDAMGEVMIEVNQLGQTLREQRLGALEAAALVRSIIEEIDAAIFAFDGQLRLAIANRAGQRLLNEPLERLTGRTAEKLGLLQFFSDDGTRTVEHTFAGGSGRWEVRRTTFREKGLPHQLLVITNLSRALREEERQAWQRLVRVIGHELNNSLTPIKSIASSLEGIVKRERLPDDWSEDMKRGLGVISSRAESLTRFMDGYARLARLPRPSLQTVDVEQLIRRVAELERRAKVEVVPGPRVIVRADPDQLEQLLINLVRNAVEAADESRGRVSVRWVSSGENVEIIVEDEGPGLSGSANLFVPFFTTKPGGTGIGLALSRQIAEAHGGSLVLRNREGQAGCEAHLQLPIGWR